jgi:hypothetical protein
VQNSAVLERTGRKRFGLSAQAAEAKGSGPDYVRASRVSACRELAKDFDLTELDGAALGEMG